MRNGKKILFSVLGLLAANAIMMTSTARAAEQPAWQICVWETTHDGRPYQGCESWPLTSCGTTNCATRN